VTSGTTVGRVFGRVCKPLAYGLGFLVCGLILVPAAMWTVSLVPANTETACDGPIPVYVHSNGVHVDLVLPVVTDVIDWRTVADPNDTDAVEAAAACPFISFGWGAREFYLNVPEWRDLTPGVAFRAICGLGGSALHTWYEPVPREGEDCVRIGLDRASYARLVAFIRESGVRGDDGRFVPVVTSVRYGRRDAFYVGVGHYRPWNSCNTWANRALKVCGVRCCAWSAFPGPILRQVRR